MRDVGKATAVEEACLEPIPSSSSESTRSAHRADNFRVGMSSTAEVVHWKTGVEHCVEQTDGEDLFCARILNIARSSSVVWLDWLSLLDNAGLRSPSEESTTGMFEDQSLKTPAATGELGSESVKSAQSASGAVPPRGVAQGDEATEEATVEGGRR